MKLRNLLILLTLLSGMAWSQGVTPPAVPLPWPRACFYDANGAVLAGGKLYSYVTGTSTPLATYVDASGTIQNTNPVLLDSGGCAQIWIGPQTYRLKLTDSSDVQQWQVDGISNVGQLSYANWVALSPVGNALQTVLGPLAAYYFQGTLSHTTSPGVRVAILDPTTVLDTANPPNMITVPPAASGHNYRIPDPLGHATFVMNPDPTQSGVNGLDCTQAGITCKRRQYVYFEGGGCNNTTSGLGWDTFGTNSPTPFCVTGTNIQKGVLALPAAATYIQENTGTGAAAGTVVVTYTNTTVAGNLLVATVAVDGGKTVTGCTDGTNAYTKAINKVNGNTDLEIWYFNGTSASKTAGTSLTCTLSANANAAIDWKEYTGLTSPVALDVTASNSATSTAVTTGTTAGTAQASNLVIAAVASPSNPSVVAASGWVRHTVVSQSTNITVADAGQISNTIQALSGGFTLGSSQAWASAIVTFKVSVGATTTAQRTWRIPSTYRAADAVNATLNWQNPLQGTGTINTKLGAAVVCTAAGSTDDPAFLAAITASAAISATSAGIVTETPLSALTTTGCASSSLMHFQVQRLRYDPADTYEGFVYLNGAALDYGSSN